MMNNDDDAHKNAGVKKRMQLLEQGFECRILLMREELEIKSDNLSHFKKYCDIFSNYKDLEKLTVDFRIILSLVVSFTDEYSQVLCVALGKCKKLKELELSNFTCKAAPCEVQHFIALCNTIATLDQLEVLCLRGNCLSNLNMECIQAFKNALSQLPNLTSIDLGNNSLSELNEPCCLALCEAALSCNLSSFNLQDNYLYKLNGEFLKVLLEKLLTAPNLCKIFIGSSNEMVVSRKNVNTFFHILKGHPSLMKIKGVPLYMEQEKELKELFEKRERDVRGLRPAVSLALPLPRVLHEHVLGYMVHQCTLIELEASTQESKQQFETLEQLAIASAIRKLKARFESEVEESVVEQEQKHVVTRWTSSNAFSSSTDTEAQRRQQRGRCCVVL